MKTPIYTIYLFKFDYNEKYKEYMETRNRTVGFFFDINRAKESILNNDGDMFENNYYDYAYVEEIHEGIYPSTKIIKCYHVELLDNNPDIYQISECENPNPSNFVNYSMG